MAKKAFQQDDVIVYSRLGVAVCLTGEAIVCDNQPRGSDRGPAPIGGRAGLILEDVDIWALAWDHWSCGLLAW